MPDFEFYFLECDTCRRKPGAPKLCAGCVHNRWTISEMKRRLAAKAREEEN